MKEDPDLTGGHAAAVRRQVHDIEDLKKEGSRQRGCPYYAARKFAVDAELVFCPYSYLVRKTITSSVIVTSVIYLFLEKRGWCLHVCY